MVVWALGRQQTQQKHMQMYAKHVHACTLYGRRLHPTEIMDLRNLQGCPNKAFRGKRGGSRAVGGSKYLRPELAASGNKYLRLAVSGNKRLL